MSARQAKRRDGIIFALFVAMAIVACVAFVILFGTGGQLPTITW